MNRNHQRRAGWSPYKDTVIAYVTRHPGCCKFAVARWVTRNPQRCPSKQYYIVNTALRNGWITGQWQGNRWALYVPGAEPVELPTGTVQFDSEGGFSINPE